MATHATYSVVYTVNIFEMTGSLQMLEGVYTEYQVINYLLEPLYVQDRQGVEVEADHHFASENGQRKVEVTIRNVVGTRKPSGTHREDWNGKVKRITLTYDELQKNPVYVKEIDKLFYVGPTRANARHPLTRFDSIRSFDEVSEVIRDSYKNAILNILVNDTKGILGNQVYTLVNGKVCGVPVLRNTHIEDGVTIAYRDGKNAQYIVAEHLTIDQIAKSTGSVVTAEGTTVIIANNAVLLETAVEQQKLRTSTLLSPEILTQYKRDVELANKTKIEQLEAGILEGKAKLKKEADIHKEELIDKDRAYARHKQIVEKEIEDLKLEKAQLIQRNAHLTKEIELSIETAGRRLSDKTLQYNDKKLESQERVEAIRERKEHVKATASNLSTTATVLKAAAAIAPVVVAGALWIASPGAAAAATVSSVVGTCGPQMSGLYGVFGSFTSLIVNIFTFAGSAIYSASSTILKIIGMVFS